MSYTISNILIDALLEPDRRKLLQHLTPVPLPLNASLYEPGIRPQYIHFLTSGIASIVTTMRDGGTTEVATVGREGAPQAIHVLGPISVRTRCFMQVAGTALRMDYSSFERMFAQEESIRRSLLAYAQYQTALLAQLVGCNRLHPVEARLARWILMVQDRTGEEVLGLTQEFLSQMIGSQRTTVSAVASGLSAKGLIRYSRGKVAVADRAGLQRAACECYSVTRSALRSLYSLAGQELMHE